MRYFLGLGSNLGNKHRNIEAALFFINKSVGSVVEVSKDYFSRPQGFDSDNDFLNVCIAVDSNHTPLRVLREIKRIEKKMGRTYSLNGYEDRIIDIDIIFTQRKFKSEKLIIPHSKYLTRDFVLVPLSELSDCQDPSTFLFNYQLTK